MIADRDCAAEHQAAANTSQQRKTAADTHAQQQLESQATYLYVLAFHVEDDQNPHAPDVEPARCNHQDDTSCDACEVHLMWPYQHDLSCICTHQFKVHLCSIAVTGEVLWRQWCTGIDVSWEGEF